LRGGSTRSFPVPLGTFTLKYATGTSWCSETEYFGDVTVFNEADRTLNFNQTVSDDMDGVTTYTSGCDGGANSPTPRQSGNASNIESAILVPVRSRDLIRTLFLFRSRLSVLMLWRLSVFATELYFKNPALLGNR
jgi:hypothetical protein